MSIPKDIIEKYNYLKQTTFDSLGLFFQHTSLTYNTANIYSTSDTSLSKNNQSKSIKSDTTQLYVQIEDIVKTFTDHLANISKGIILEEDCSFIQESLSKRFLEPLALKDYHYTQFSKDFLLKVDNMKVDFDQQLRKLIDHFSNERNDLIHSSERKLELLKQELNRSKNEILSIKSNQDRQCHCRYYEETIAKMKVDHERQLQNMIQKHESEILEMRVSQPKGQESYNKIREKIYKEINDRIIPYLQENHTDQYKSYLQERGQQDNIDPIELMILILSRMQTDNNWLVDKLAEMDEERGRIVEDRQQSPLSNRQLQGLLDQTLQAQQIIENFNIQRQEFLIALSKDGQDDMMRSSRQQLSQSESGKNISLKYQQLMKLGKQVDTEESYENSNYLNYNNQKQRI